MKFNNKTRRLWNPFINISDANAFFEHFQQTLLVPFSLNRRRQKKKKKKKKGWKEKETNALSKEQSHRFCSLGSLRSTTAASTKMSLQNISLHYRKSPWLSLHYRRYYSISSSSYDVGEVSYKRSRAGFKIKNRGWQSHINTLTLSSKLRFWFYVLFRQSTAKCVVKVCVARVARFFCLF